MFDRGTILAQTPYPGIPHWTSNVEDLSSLVMPKAAKMLVDGLRNRVFLHPLQDVGWCQDDQQLTAARRAPKITTEDRHIDWKTWTAENIMRKQSVIGPLWNYCQCMVSGIQGTKRIIWTPGFVNVSSDCEAPEQIGKPVLLRLGSTGHQLLVRTCDGQVLRVERAKVEGGKTEAVAPALRRAGILKLSTKSDPAHDERVPFRNCLE